MKVSTNGIAESPFMDYHSWDSRMPLLPAQSSTQATGKPMGFSLKMSNPTVTYFIVTKR